MNYPLKYFATRIGTEHIQVEFPVPSDVDPAFWTPAPETLAEFQSAELILLNGAGYAKWIDIVSLPQSKLVVTSESFEDSYIEVSDAVKHSHGPSGEHDHVGTAFTTWLDPELAIKQAQSVERTLSRLLPDKSDEFAKNYAQLEGDLAMVNESIGGILDGYEGRLIFSHPVFQYLQRRYKLDAKSVHWEPDEFPSTSQWQEFETLLESHPAKWMIWEAEPHRDSVARLSQLGVGSITFEPCGNIPSQGDYLKMMLRNAEALKVLRSE